MKDWFMLALVGEDQPGIVAKVTEKLFENGCNLGEASMTRLGGSFAIMLRADYDGDEGSLKEMLKPVAESLGLSLHVDYIGKKPGKHIEPNVKISVFGADKTGIVAKITSALAKTGFNILSLESGIAGSDDKPIYVMHMEGVATGDIDAMQDAFKEFATEGIETHISPIDTIIG